MPGNPLVVVTLLFLLSLVAAVILFAFFKSTAIITTPKYQAGGAIAGFMLVYLLLYPSYRSIAGDKNLSKVSEYQSQVTALTAENKKLQGLDAEHRLFEQTQQIEGTVSPYHDRMQVVLGFSDTEVRADKKFRLVAPCVDVANRPYTLYVIHDGVSYPYVIQHNEELSAVNIPLPR